MVCNDLFLLSSVDCLNAHFECGMTGTSKEMMPLIIVAATDVGLSIAQVEVSVVCSYVYIRMIGVTFLLLAMGEEEKLSQEAC